MLAAKCDNMPGKKHVNFWIGYCLKINNQFCNLSFCIAGIRENAKSWMFQNIQFFFWKMYLYVFGVRENSKIWMFENLVVFYLICFLCIWNQGMFFKTLDA